jgi:hypothetical protein
MNRVHLVTVVGGHVDVLPHMLEHYRSQGVESFFVNLHLAGEDDPVRGVVEQITQRFGCGIASVTVGDASSIASRAMAVSPRWNREHPSGNNIRWADSFRRGFYRPIRARWWPCEGRWR